MLEALISSRVRIKVLTLFVMHPDQEYHLKGLVQELNENNNALRRELARFEGIGLLSSQRRARSKFYRINQQHLLYPDLKSIVLKTTGLGQVLRDELDKLKHIDCAFIYGSYASGEEDARSDIDLMFVGQVDLESLQSVLQSLERQLGREINETVYAPEEFAQQRRAGDAFLERVMRKPKIMLVGDANALD